MSVELEVDDLIDALDEADGNFEDAAEILQDKFGIDLDYAESILEDYANENQ